MRSLVSCRLIGGGLLAVVLAATAVARDRAASGDAHKVTRTSAVQGVPDQLGDLSIDPLDPNDLEGFSIGLARTPQASDLTRGDREAAKLGDATAKVEASIPTAETMVRPMTDLKPTSPFEGFTYSQIGYR
jgi:hypothetical protein